MIDKERNETPDNLRGMVQDLSEALDKLAAEFRETKIFAGTRPADAKTFMLISRQPRGLTDLAEALGISRQGAHQSLQRLIDKGLVTFDFAAGSKRDKIAQLSIEGEVARQVGHDIAKSVEQRIVDILGQDQTQSLKGQIAALLAALKN